MAWIDILNSIGRNADMNVSEQGISENLYGQGAYDELVKKYLRDSGAYKNMSPAYYGMLLQGAKRLAVQSQLKDLAAGVTAENETSAENFGGRLAELMRTPGGLGWASWRELMPLYQQALANIKAWQDAPEGSQAAGIAKEFYNEDPNVRQAAMNRIKAMALVAMGPGYGGAFNSAFRNSLMDTFNNNDIWGGTDNEGIQHNFWDYLSGIFGGLAGRPRAAYSPTPNTFALDLGVAPSASASSASSAGPTGAGPSSVPTNGGTSTSPNEFPNRQSILSTPAGSTSSAPPILTNPYPTPSDYTSSGGIPAPNLLENTPDYYQSGGTMPEGPGSLPGAVMSGDVGVDRTETNQSPDITRTASSVTQSPVSVALQQTVRTSRPEGIARIGGYQTFIHQLVMAYKPGERVTMNGARVVAPDGSIFRITVNPIGDQVTVMQMGRIDPTTMVR